MHQKEQTQRSRVCFIHEGSAVKAPRMSQPEGAQLSAFIRLWAGICFLPSSEFISRICVCLASKTFYQSRRDLSKYVDIRIPEQKVAILELVFYQKLSRSISHQNYQCTACKWKCHASESSSQFIVFFILFSNSNFNPKLFLILNSFHYLLSTDKLIKILF